MLQQELSFLTMLLLLCQHGVNSELAICEGDPIQISCAQGTLQILSANYGRKDATTCSAGRPADELSNTACTLSSTLSLVNTKCDGKPSCSIDVNNNFFTDPCPGTYKYLSVSYNCVLPPTPPPPPPQTITICQGESRTITCGSGRTISIHYANYERCSRKICPRHHHHSSHESSKCPDSPTTNVQKRCNKRSSCDINFSKSYFSELCTRIYNCLEVSYSCIKKGKPGNE